MNAVSVIDADRQLNQEVLAGRLREAYDRWYDDDIVRAGRVETGET